MLTRTRELVSTTQIKRRILSEVKKFITTTCADDLQLLETVGTGPIEFRIRFIRAFPNGTVDETIANRVFAFLSEQVVKKFGDAASVSELLDSVEVFDTSPPTEAEIEDAWEFDSATSEEAKRLFDLPTGAHRKEH